MTILTGDCRILMPDHGPFDLILADPPYGGTSLAWDRRVDGWLTLACAALKPSGSLWVFGSLRCFMTTAEQFVDAGLRSAQEIVWEKQNGTSFHADRFKRVHELVAQFYRGTPFTTTCRPPLTPRRAPCGASCGHRTPAISTPVTMSAMTAARGSCAPSSMCATATAAPSIRPRSRPRSSKS